MKEILSLQRKAYDQKKAREKQLKREEKRDLRRKQKEEEERLAKITAKQKADVKNWLAKEENAVVGAGKRTRNLWQKKPQHQKAKGKLPKRSV